jgi:hypothetical protein
MGASATAGSLVVVFAIPLIIGPDRSHAIVGKPASGWSGLLILTVT